MSDGEKQLDLENIVVDGEVDRGVSAQFIDGLRQLMKQGEEARRVLDIVESGRPFGIEAPLLEALQDNHRHFSVSFVPVHSAAPVPPLPDLACISYQLVRKLPAPRVFGKPRMNEGRRGYTIILNGPGLAVLPNGRMVEAAIDPSSDEAIIGTVCPTRSGVSWNLRKQNGARRTLDALRSDMAKSITDAFIIAHTDGSEDPIGLAKSRQVYRTLRDRCSARLILDGHVERIRQEIVHALAVDAVHAL